MVRESIEVSYVGPDAQRQLQLQSHVHPVIHAHFQILLEPGRTLTQIREAAPRLSRRRDQRIGSSGEGIAEDSLRDALHSG